MTRPLSDVNIKMRGVAMDLARHGYSSDELRVQMRVWCEEAAARANEWAACEDARMLATLPEELRDT